MWTIKCCDKKYLGHVDSNFIQLRDASCVLRDFIWRWHGQAPLNVRLKNRMIIKSIFYILILTNTILTECPQDSIEIHRNKKLICVQYSEVGSWKHKRIQTILFLQGWTILGSSQETMHQHWGWGVRTESKIAGVGDDSREWRICTKIIWVETSLFWHLDRRRESCICEKTFF